MSITLPAPAHDYFAAANAGDVERTAALFAEEARVQDEGTELQGRTAIREWIARTMRQYGATATPERHDADGRVSTITALVSGNFPGSPARLTYRFEIEDEQIVRLEIH